MKAFDVQVETWMKQAACTDPSIDPDWFFPEVTNEKSLEQKLALVICENCPVKIECLAYAMKNWPVYGIWGGLKNIQLSYLAKQTKEQQ